MLPLNPFLTFIGQNSLFSASDKVLVAVSGGRDSVLLALLFNEAKFNFGIAHCNFGLRGAESDTDETFVKELAARLNVPFHHTRFDTNQYAAENKLSIQMAARELRYTWFEELRKEGNYDCVALAHHRSDITETVLLNLVRGTGISGLHGIMPKRGNIVRPLLFLTREDIDRIVTEEGISFREDSSNLSTKYARNKIRIEVIPKLIELNPSVHETFQANGKRFLELEEFFEEQVKGLRAQLFQSPSDNEIQISLQKLKKLRPQSLLLYHLFKPYGFSEAVLSDLSSSWDGHAGKTFESVSHQILLDRDQVFLLNKEKCREEVHTLHRDEAALRLSTFTIIYHQKNPEALTITANPNVATLDAEKLLFPLKLRYWKQGDVFYPLGMKGKKKLSDFFTDLKIPLHQKNNIPILENGNGEIVWVVGYRIDDRYKVSAHSKKVYIFEKHKLHGKQTNI